MADDSLPYLSDVTINPKLPSDGVTVQVALAWKAGPVQPDTVQIYAAFGGSAADLTGHPYDAAAPDAKSVTLHIPVPSNHNPFLFVGIAPRNLDGDGNPENMMDNAEGDSKSWETFVSQAGLEIIYTTSVVTKPPLPSVNAVSYTKTLSDGDHIQVTVAAANASSYNLIVNNDAGNQMNSSSGVYRIAAVPRNTYFFKAEQYSPAQSDWSLFTSNISIVAKPRVRRLRDFLNFSGVLRPGVRVRQYAADTRGSVRGMMGL